MGNDIEVPPLTNPVEDTIYKGAAGVGEDRNVAPRPFHPTIPFITIPHRFQPERFLIQKAKQLGAWRM
jgi:hypothetical protein